jgi:hypothetical protein
MLKQIVLTTLCLCLLAVPASVSAFTLGTDYSESINVSGNTYTSTVEFQDGFIGWLQTESWGHTLSEDFMTVPDNFTVNSASLRITGHHAVGNGIDEVTFGGTCNWTAYEGWTWCWDETDNLFDLTNIDNSYWNNSPLMVSMTPIFDLGVCLTNSILTVNYGEPGSPGDVTAVPEPTTLLLLASGLVGAGYFRRRG